MGANQSIMRKWAISILVALVIAAGGVSGGIRAQEPDTGPYHELMTLGRGMGHGAAWSPDGKWLAVSESSIIRIYTANLEDVISINTGKEGYYNTDISFSADGAYIIRPDRDGVVRVWSTRTGELVHVIEYGPDPLSDIAWESGGTRFALGGHGRILLFSSISDTLPQVFYTEMAINLTWSPDGHYLATAGSSGRIWDIELGTVTTVLHTDGAYVLAWSPDGSQIASGGGSYDDNHVEIWDAATGQRLDRIQTDRKGYIGATAWHPDGTTLAVSKSLYECDPIQLVDLANGEMFDLATTAFGEVIGWNADGNRLAVLACDGRIELWNTDTRELIASRYDHLSWIESMAWSPDGSQLAIINGDKPVSGIDDDNRVQVWDISSGEIRWHNTVSGGKFLLWSPDDKDIVAGGFQLQNCDLRRWDAKTGEFLGVLERPHDGCPSIPSPDLTKMAETYGEYDNKSIDIIDIPSGEVISTLPITYGGGVIWSPDGRWVIDRHRNVWNAISGISTGVRIWDSGPINWSPDSHWINAGSRTIWDVSTGETTLLQPDNNIHFEWKWSPDGRRIAGIGSGYVDIWEWNETTLTGELLATLPCENTLGVSSIVPIEWSPDSTKLAVSNHVGTITIWSEQ
jgi:WD40 repeat protein